MKQQDNNSLTPKFKTAEEKSALRKEHFTRRLISTEMVGNLQNRLKKSQQISKANKGDNEVQQYQGGRQTELRYAITLLLTPRQKVQLGNSTNPDKFITSPRLSKIVMP